MKKRADFAFLFAAALAACALAAGAADYPGNPNFRNVNFVETALTRTDWVTNVTTIVSESTNPGYAAPIDWDRYAKPIAPGIDHIPAVLTKEGRWPTNMVCHLLRIDLSTPGLRFTGTDRCPEGWGEDMPDDELHQAKKGDGTFYKKRTVREKTTDFLARNRGAKSLGGKARDARVAFNLAAWLPWKQPYTNLWGEPYSPLYSDGRSVSFASLGTVANAAGDITPNSMIVVYKDGTAELVHSITEETSKKIWFCAPAFVAEMVSSGQIPQHAMQCDPRTALGISEDRKTLYLFMCDGRIEGWSGGCYWSSLSTLLLAMGCYHAINLDGGGSATLCVWDESAQKPAIVNRPSYGLRDNGSNAAIYYKSPDAMVGTWLYDDMDFLVQDIADGEIPAGETTINVLGAATFTAEHPAIPAGAAFTLASTNGASVGWADGVAPQVLAGSTVTFSNICLRTGADALAVAAGGKAVLADVTGLGRVSSADAAGLVIAGSVPDGLRVACAAAPNVGDVFATSSLPLAAARAEAKKIVGAGDGTLSAEAVEEGGVVKLRWCRIVTVGSRSGRMSESLDSVVVKVRIDDCAAEYSTGYKLKLTIASEDGLRSATRTVDFTGPGAYAFDSADTSDPTICATGYAYSYKVELVDAAGEWVPHSEVASGDISVRVSRTWFRARAADDSAYRGSWTSKPGVADGRFLVSESAPLDFAADSPRTGRVRYESDVMFGGYVTDSLARQMLAAARSAYAMPHGACFAAKDGSGAPVWRALVAENGEPTLKTLYGPVALGTPTKVFCEVDWSTGAALVRYSVAVGGGAETALVDEGGASWFAGASSADVAAGRVLAAGAGSVAVLSGQYAERRLEKFFHIGIR